VGTYSDLNSIETRNGYRGKQQIRVLHANKQYAPWIGGVEAVVQEICEYMNESADIRCEVLACRDRGGRSYDDINGVPVTRVASLGTALSMPLAITFPYELERMAMHCNIVHVHLPFPAAFLSDWRCIKERGSRIVIHYHSDVIRPLQRALLEPLAGLQRRLFEAADRVIVTSEGLLNSSNTLLHYREKCQVVPLSINLEKLRDHTQQELQGVRAKFGIDERRPVVLSVARLVYYKGIQFLIDAIRTLDVTLVVAGEGPLRGRLTKQIHDAGLVDRVALVGRVSDEDLSRMYSMADLFVLPSVEPSEAFGLVQLEAMARGLPVINTNLPGGVPSVSIHGMTGLTVPPGSSEQLREAIMTVLRDRQLRDEFSQQAKCRVQRFSRTVVLEKIRAIYHSLARDGDSLS
jgi:rhamnosyl/mannosyltransferase